MCIYIYIYRERDIYTYNNINHIVEHGEEQQGNVRRGADGKGADTRGVPGLEPVNTIS